MKKPLSFRLAAKCKSSTYEKDSVGPKYFSAMIERVLKRELGVETEIDVSDFHWDGDKKLNWTGEEESFKRELEKYSLTTLFSLIDYTGRTAYFGDTRNFVFDEIRRRIRNQSETIARLQNENERLRDQIYDLEDQIAYNNSGGD